MSVAPSAGSIEQRAQAVDRFDDLLGVAGKAEAQITFAHRSEGAARREADLGAVQHLLGKGEAVVDPVDPEKRVEGSLGSRDLDPPAGLQAIDRRIAGGAAARDKRGDERLALA